MVRTRLRPAGFDARPQRPSSLRAQEQQLFCAAAERDETLNGAATPPPSRVTPLTQQVRALYEDGGVPVREIARFAGVSERTLYKHAAKGCWRRRYGPDGIAAAADTRPARGAGGRFVRSDDAGRPFAGGLKAVDPDGHARALPLVARAAALAEAAAQRTRRMREALSDARTMALMAGLVRNLAAIEDADARAAAAEALQRDDEAELARQRAAMVRKIEAAVAGWQELDQEQGNAGEQGNAAEQDNAKDNANAARRGG